MSLIFSMPSSSATLQLKGTLPDGPIMALFPNLAKLDLTNQGITGDVTQLSDWSANSQVRRRFVWSWSQGPLDKSNDKK